MYARLYWRALLLGMLCALAACSPMRVATLATVPLPAATGGNCCWQALQQLEVTYQERQLQLTAAFANKPEGASLVLLDPLGRRMLSVTQQGDGLEVYRAPELPQDLPAQFLLASSMLSWWPEADWQRTLEGTPWQLQAASRAKGTSYRQLTYKGKPLLLIDYGSAAPAQVAQGIGRELLGASERVLLSHERLPLRIRVTSVQWEALE